MTSTYSAGVTNCLAKLIDRLCLPVTEALHTRILLLLRSGFAAESFGYKLRIELHTGEQWRGTYVPHTPCPLHISLALQR
eukprot:SAG25_NODE_1137_length_3822_cov_1.656460_7_plen_80_part_00